MSRTPDPTGDLSAEKQALIALRKLRARVDELERGRSEPIAIVGLGCRFPGRADGPDAYWRVLRDAVDTIAEVPRERWDIDEFYDADPEAPGKMYTRHGGFIENPDRFDPQFFGISPREAVSLDPQHRLILEVSWEALEHAGQNPARLLGESVGVFVGISTSDYGLLQMQRGNPALIDTYFGIGNAANAAAGRVSYTLGLQGPSIAVDTACSSSLVAVHTACQSLRSGDCRMALVGGVNLILAPEITINFSRARMMAPDGRCKTFDAAADGYVRGEGCGVIVLKRLSDAIADRDRILAVIRGSSVNQDGRSSGFTAPSELAQETVIRQALRNSGLRPADVQYLEAHGTGTSLGDPIEVQAAAAALGEGRPPDRPLKLGSAKTNLGHLEAAAGIAGLIKLVLSLQHDAIPPSLHFRTPNPHIPWAELPVEVVTTLTEWKRGAQPRIASVSSFGFSGTNAHVIVGDAPESQPRRADRERPRHVIALSARSDTALRALASRYADVLDDLQSASIPDICHTANTGRAVFAHRLAATASTGSELREALARFGRTEDTGGRVVAGESAAGDLQNGPVFLFTGQGSQYPGMGRQLFETQSTFRAALEQCDEILRGCLEQPLLSVIYPAPGAPSAISETAYTQPALFAIEYALAQLWRSWGVEPAAVIGHSIGEYVAACVAGVLDVKEALLAVAARGRLMQALPSGGAMAAVFADVARVRAALAGFEDSLAVAAINAQENTVISGEVRALDEVLASLARKGITAQRLDVSHAFHSPLMEPMLDAFEREMSALSFRTPRLPVVSNLTGELVKADFRFDASYWRRHARGAVNFAGGIRALAARGYRTFLEVGPTPTLTSFGRLSGASADSLWAGSLRKGRDDWEQMLGSVAALFVRGCPIDFVAFDRDYPREKVALPTYPFERERYWIDTTPSVRQVRPASAPVYKVAWTEESAAPAEQSTAGQNTWLIFEDQGGVGARLAGTLTSDGARVIRVTSGGAASPIVSTDALAIDPQKPEHFGSVWETVGAGRQGNGALNVVYLWPLDVAASDTGANLLSSAVASCASLLYLFQSLTETPHARARVSVVTRGAQPVNAGDPLALAQAPLLGQLNATLLEFPELSAVPVDLDPSATPADYEVEADVLVRELRSTERGERVAIRAGRRHVARLASAGVVLPETTPIRADASYLVTGGLGALGLMVARWLVDRGARHITLVGRREPTDSMRQTIRELEGSGATVTVARGDATRDADVARIIGEVQRERPALRGIVHAAGVRDDGVVGQQTPKRFETVMAPKVAGAWHLHARTRDIPLDFFVLFSSSASVFGSPGQSNYGAANAFLGALAHERRRAGLPATSIEWGPWASDGMAGEVSDADRRRWARVGLELIQPAKGIGWLDRVAAGPLAQAVVLPVDWSRFVPEAGASLQSFLRDMAPAEAHAAGAQSAKGSEDFTDQLKRLPQRRRQAAIESHVRDQVGQVLALAPSVRLGPNDGFRDLGMDSLMAIDLRNRLQRTLGCTLPATLAFDHPTVNALAAHLGRELLDAFATGPSVTPGVSSVDGAGHEPIAIVGIGCRFPGGASDPDAFWRLLHDGVDAITEVPRERWDVDAFYDADPDAPGKMYTRWGGFLEGIDQFDPRFFGISSREAVSLDPQQRLLLEVSWEALEHAGQRPDGLRGSATGVFVGISGNEYVGLQLNGKTLADLDAYAGTGNAPSMAAGRLSFTMGLQGPSFAVDTACSSSLVAVHLACQSLSQQECRLALAGGVNLILAPTSNVVLSRARMMAPDGRCKTFDARADGYVRGEGCGIVVLKRLADALEDGDRILAVIRGTAVNQDGRTSGLTVPNGPAQEALIRSALSQAGVTPGDVSYVEAHGTGTSLGDPIEVGALGAVLCAERRPEDPLRLGSVKTNVGHLEAAAGVAGLIKTVLALQHEQIPPHLHLTTLNPHVEWERLSVEIPTAPVTWPRGPRPRIAGVSSFGFSGTNAHVVLEEPPAVARPAAVCARPSHVLSLSARNAVALRSLAERFLEYLDSSPDADLADVCFTANTGRAQLEYRLAAAVFSTDELRACLSAFVAGDEHRGLVNGRTDLSAVPDVALVFGNQSVDSAGAGELYETQPVFQRAVDRCAALAGASGRELLQHADDGTSPFDRATRDAVCQFVVQHALAELWRSWGISPSAVAGSGIGEYAAGCVAGVFDVHAGLQLVMAHRDAEVRQKVADAIDYQAPQVDVISVASGAVVNDAVTGVAYWTANRATDSAKDAAGNDALPPSDLRIHIDGGNARWESLLESLAKLYVAGASVDWNGFDRGYPRQKLTLPTYPFQRERYWVDGAREAAIGSAYEVEWQPFDAPATGTPGQSAAPAGEWLIFADRSSVGGSVASALGARGSHVQSIVMSGAPSSAGEIDPDDRDGFRRVIESLDPNVGPRDIVFMSAVETPGGSMASSAEVEGAAELACHGLLHLAQALIDRPSIQARLWIVTKGTQAAGPDVRPLAVGQSSLWGFGRVLSLEHPEWSVRLVDLDDRDPSDDASALVEELSRVDAEDHVALRGGRRFVARLVPSASRPGAPARWSADATYLVTGGLGSLGLKVAAWLVDRGARHLVLIGRRGLSASSGTSSTAEAIADLRKRADVKIVAADVADAVAMRRLFDDVRDSPFPLRGVVHAAGVNTLAEVADLNGLTLDGVLRPKVAGGWLLHRLTESLTLDFFVMFSSIASVWGARGLAAYGGANQFLDAVAHHRHALGLPALSINWGPWAGGGMTSDEGRAGLQAVGVDAFTPDAALKQLESLMTASRPQTTVARVQWGVFKPVYLARGAHPLLDRVGPVDRVPQTQTTTSGSTLAIEQLRTAHAAERQSLLESWTQEELAAVLGPTLGGAPEPDARFFDLGMDSLTSVELRRRLERRFGCTLEPTLVFDFPTVERLAAHLVDRLGVGMPNARLVPQSAAAASGDPMQRITEMSEEEVERLFAQKMLNQGT